MKATASRSRAMSCSQRVGGDVLVGKINVRFDVGKADGNGSMKPLLGGKGANLAEMSRIGLPVPPGFTITTEVCTYFTTTSGPTRRRSSQVKAGVANIEKIMGTKFGDKKPCPCWSPSAPARATPCPA
jgi:pyruvate,orthophosphate dikinase